MRRIWIKLVPLSAVALALLVSACSDQVGPDRDQLRPEAASLARGGRSESRAEGRERRGPKVRGRKNGVEKEYRLAVKPRGKGSASASAWVDQNGGSLSLSGHTLTIPAGAVSERTQFIIRESHQTVEEDLVVLALDLTATRGTGRSNSVDVGTKGFAVPVTLCVAYDQAVDWQAEAIGEATLIWLQNVAHVNETVDSWASGNQVCALLDHFSLWGLAWP